MGGVPRLTDDETMMDTRQEKCLGEPMTLTLVVDLGESKCGMMMGQPSW